MNTELQKLDTLLEHIDNVRKNCEKLGKKLIENGEFDVGLRLIANGQIHDQSKFYGLEWQHLWPTADPRKMRAALYQHTTNPANRHHPEAWASIHDMTNEYLAEMVCDWKARSSEFGTDLREYLDQRALKRFGFNKEQPVYAKITKFIDLLCEKPFVAPVDEKEQTDV